MRGRLNVLTLIVFAVAIAAGSIGASERLVSPAFGTTDETQRLDLAIPWGASVATCPARYSPTTECNPRQGSLVAVQGLGYLSETYVFAFETAAPECAPGFALVLPSSGRLTVKDRGEIFFGLGGSNSCAAFGADRTDVHLVSQTFTITGGSGVFAGSSGSGVVTRPRDGVDNWKGTFSAPNFVEDLTAPTITGAVDKKVAAPRHARTIRVRYTVTASDDVDGPVAAVCSPRSGTRFKVGRRTTVHCSATDKSANTATVTFHVVVRRSKR